MGKPRLCEDVLVSCFVLFDFDIVEVRLARTAKLEGSVQGVVVQMSKRSVFFIDERKRTVSEGSSTSL